MSHIQQTLDLVAQLRSEVCESLRIGNAQYDELFYESGCQYLESKYAAEYAAALQSHRLFWSWWRVEYTAKDREYLRRVRHNIPKRTQNFYTTIHVTIDYTPGKNITDVIIKDKKHETRAKNEALRIVDEQ